MRKLSLFLLIVIGSLPALVSVSLAADQDVFRAFGMLGRQAFDCKAPASQSNPYNTYAVTAQGQLTRTLKMHPDLDGTYPLRDVVMSGPDLLQFREKGRQSELIVNVAKIEGKFRSWRSVRADGTVLIADGKFASSGLPMPSFEFCGN